MLVATVDDATVGSGADPPTGLGGATGSGFRLDGGVQQAWTSDSESPTRVRVAAESGVNSTV
jgi:hypothetical protein